MEPLDLTRRPPRGPREQLLGLAFMPRTIDKICAQLPGGNLGGYVVDLPHGVSVYLLKKINVDLAELKAVVARAADETEVAAWLADHADLSDIAGVNARLESLTIDRLRPHDRALVEAYHPILRERSDLHFFFDIFEADDALLATRR